MKKITARFFGIFNLTFLLIFLLFLFSNRSNAQQNIAPLATVSTSDPWNWNNINDLNFGTCGNQEAFVWTANPPSSVPGVDWMQWDFSRVRSFDSLIIHHAQTTGRFLTGALVQYWDGNSWVNHTTFSNLSQANCVNRVSIGKLSTDRFRLTVFEMNGTGQTSNPNFREIEIIEAPSGSNDAVVFSLDSLNAFCAGSHDVYATIGNFGVNQLDSVDVHWEVNGVPQPTIHYNQLLDTVNGNLPYRVSILLGNISLNAGSTEIKIYTSLPNGMLDTINYNDTLIKVIETATPPTDLLAFNATTTSMDFEAFGLAGNVDYEYGPDGFIPGTGVMGSSTVNPFTITGLQPSTNYDIYIRSNCGGSDTSTWVGPFGFCTDYVASFYNDMESEDLGVPPVCWNTKITSSNAFIEVQAYTGISSPYAGSRALYMYSSNSTSTDTVMAISPELADLPVGDKQVRFHANSDDPISQLIVGTMASPDATVLNPIDTITFQQSYTYEEVIVTLDAANGYNGTDEYVYLAHSLGATYDYIRIDNFYYEPIPSCKKPTDLYIENLAPDSVDIGWTENNLAATLWEVRYGSAGFNLDTGLSINMSNNPATLNGLTPDTLYDYYVRTICGRGDSSYWSGPVGFETPCLLSTAPYFNNFEMDPLDDEPQCWRSEATVYYSSVEVDDQTGLAAPFSGSKALYMYGYNGTPGLDKVMAITPGFSDLTAGDKQIRFFANSDDPASELIIGTMANPKDTGLNPLDTITFAAADTYQEVIFEFTAGNGYNGTDQYIYLMHSLGATFDYIRIDDFHYELIPSCSKPDYSSLSIDSLTATTVDFSWIEPGAATLWEVEYGPVGFTPGTGTSDTSSSNPSNITGLTPNTVYEIYVRTVCGRGDTSYASGPYIFETPCTPTTAPYYNNFETDPINEEPICWRTFKTEYNTYADVRSLTLTNAPYAGSRALYMYSSNATGFDKLLSVSPGFSDLTAGDKQIRFFANTSETVSELIFGTMPSPIDTANMHPLDTIVFSTANRYEEIIFEITAANGYNGTDEYIYFQHNLGSTYDYIRIDEFHYETIPTCKKPNSLSVSNITTNTADLYWFEKNVATEWQIEYGPSGFILGTGIDSIATTNPFTITGLDSATYYEFYVRSLCGRGDTSFWTGPFEFVTECPASYSAPYFNDFEDERLDLDPICWSSIANVNFSWVEVEDFTGTAAPYSGTQALYMYPYNASPTTDTVMAITPRFAGLTANNKRISFYGNSDGTAVKLIVGTMSSPTSTVLNVIDTITFTTPDVYQKVEVQFDASTGYNGTDEYIYLMHNLGANYQYIRIDDFRYFEVPPIDAGITDLIAPENNINKCFTSSENLSVALTALGWDNLDFTVDTTVVTVNVTGAHTQSYSYTIDDNSLNAGLPLVEDDTIGVPMGTVDMSNPGVYYFDISLSMNNDGKVSNNTFRDTVRASLGGSIIGSDTICLGDTMTLSTEGFVGSLQWQSSTGGVFTDIVGADSSEVEISPSVITSYRVLACGMGYSDTLTVEPITVAQPIALDSTLVISCGDTGTVPLIATSTNPNVSFEWFDVPTGGNALEAGGNIVSISPNGDTLFYKGTSTNPNNPSIDTLYVSASVGGGGSDTALPVPHNSVYTGSARGYHFEAPVDFTITGLEVAIEAGKGNQHVAVLKTDNNVPWNLWNAAIVPFTTLYYTTNASPTGYITVNIPIKAGEKIAILGQRGTSNSYSNASTIEIEGKAVSIQRFIMQANLDNTAPANAGQLGYEAAANISRVNFTYSTGCESTRDTVIATIDCLVDIDEVGNSLSNISIQPNPSQGIFHIVGNQVKEEVEVSIFNANGKLVYQSEDKLANNFDERIDISDYAKGMYFVKLQSESSMQMKKIVVQ